ncbi:MAG: hypothetical protein JOZ69_06865 [Myxococcales bacterium]|nr:hypothetical protein [Myxococcales bacterium]
MPDPTLPGTALRYAAGDLPPDEVAAFEARLADDQDARDALAEAVRLSAAAIGQQSPAPHPSFRAAIRARLNLRAYRGHPFAWVGLGGAVAAACALLGVALADRPDPPAAATAPPPAEAIPAPRAVEPRAVAVAPMPREEAASVAAEHPLPAACGDERSVAEIWADLSTPEHVEKARDDELRWRQHVRALAHPHHVSGTAKAAGVADAAHP